MRTGRLTLLALWASMGTAGCGGMLASGSDEAAGPRPLEVGLAAMERGDFQRAEEHLWRAARTCESGPDGRSALLLLAALELDVRSPPPDPDEAARLSAAFLRLPYAPPDQLALARGLYVLALDHGAAPLDREGSDRTADLGDVRPAGRASDGSALAHPALATAESAPAASEHPRPVPATRFARCEGGGMVEWRRILPEHPATPLADRLRAAEMRLDSVARSAEGLRSERTGLRARIEELEAELARIRKLLEGGGGR